MKEICYIAARGTVYNTYDNGLSAWGLGQFNKEGFYIRVTETKLFNNLSIKIGMDINCYTCSFRFLVDGCLIETVVIWFETSSNSI